MKRKVFVMLIALVLALAAAPPLLDAADVERVSVDNNGKEGRGDSTESDMSADGRYVAFVSKAALVPEDINRDFDVYLRDRESGKTTLISLNENGEGMWGVIGAPSISADGRYVAFVATPERIPWLKVPVAYVHDRETGESKKISVEGMKKFSSAAISGNGEFVAVSGTALASAHSVQNRVYVVSRVSGAAEAIADGSGVSLSGDGRYVAFVSTSALVPEDGDPFKDAYVYDRQSGQMELVSKVLLEESPGAMEVSISSDGGYVAYVSSSSLYILNRQDGTVKKLKAFAGKGPDLSGDGKSVVFYSPDNNLVEGDGARTWDIFRYERDSNTYELVSVDGNGSPGNGDSFKPSISADGGLVAFSSRATNLVPDDRNGKFDVFALANGASCADEPEITVDSFGPTTIWPPNHKEVLLRASGNINVPEGCELVEATYSVVDDGGMYSVNGAALEVNDDGSFEFSYGVEAWRDGGNKAGRHYSITFSAKVGNDKSDPNLLEATSGVFQAVVPHSKGNGKDVQASDVTDKGNNANKKVKKK